MIFATSLGAPFALGTDGYRTGRTAHSNSIRFNLTLAPYFMLESLLSCLDYGSVAARCEP